MKITVHGAGGGEVTGSCYLVEAGPARVLVDFGLFQGRHSERRNALPPGLDPARLDAVLLTHAHLDHVGRLPLLVPSGFRGPIFATGATIELALLILADAARIQAQDAERENRKRQRAGLAPVAPLYSEDDVEALKPLFEEVELRQPVEIAPRVNATWFEAGHMLGSGSIRLHESDGGKSCVFSGDIGPEGVPILEDPEPFDSADLVLLESTYGDRAHRPYADTVAEFESVIERAIAGPGKILIPAFAVGRTQQLLYHMALLFQGRALPRFPVAVDSPMAIRATQIYRKHPDLYDVDAAKLMAEGVIARGLASLHLSETREQSMALNGWMPPCMILAGAGMCNAGRILHHLKQNLWRPETHVIFVGFQAYGTLGRKLVDGAKRVSIHGESIAVKAQIHTINGFSAHAGQPELLRWIDRIASKSKPVVALTHGENDARSALAAEIARRHRIEVRLPSIGETLGV